MCWVSTQQSSLRALYRERKNSYGQDKIFKPAKLVQRCERSLLKRRQFCKMASRRRALYQNEVEKWPLYQPSWICWTFSVESLSQVSKCVPYDHTRLDTIWHDVIISNHLRHFEFEKKLQISTSFVNKINSFKKSLNSRNVSQKYVQCNNYHSMNFLTIYIDMYGSFCFFHRITPYTVDTQVDQDLLET